MAQFPQSEKMVRPPMLRMLWCLCQCQQQQQCSMFNVGRYCHHAQRPHTFTQHTQTTVYPGYMNEFLSAVANCTGPPSSRICSWLNCM